MKGVRTVKGRPVCLTAWDAWGRAHLRHPLDWSATVCGRQLGSAAAPTGKSCSACAEGARLANVLLRAHL